MHYFGLKGILNIFCAKSLVLVMLQEILNMLLLIYWVIKLVLFFILMEELMMTIRKLCLL